MANARPTEGRPTSREEKVDEILAILGELYQRVGYQHAAPVNAGTAGPETQFLGYRPYTARPYATPTAGPPWGPGFRAHPEARPVAGFAPY